MYADPVKGLLHIQLRFMFKLPGFYIQYTHGWQDQERGGIWVPETLQPREILRKSKCSLTPLFIYVFQIF